MKIDTRHTVFAAVMTALCAFGPAAANAQQPSTSTEKPAAPAPARPDRAKTVSLTDLDLSTPDGVRAAHERLHEVARTLCSQVEGDMDLSHRENYLACVNEAMARSLPKIEQLARKNAPSRGLASNRDK